MALNINIIAIGIVFEIYPFENMKHTIMYN
jgi:hypothetical protein